MLTYVDKGVSVYKPRIVFIATQVIKYEKTVIIFSNCRLIHDVSTFYNAEKSHGLNISLKINNRGK